MKLLKAWWADTHSRFGRRPLLPETTLLGIPYQPDWLDVLGLALVLTAVAAAALLLAVR